MTTCGPNLVRDECFLAGPAIQSQEMSPPWFINVNSSASVSIVPLRPWNLALLRDRLMLYERMSAMDMFQVQKNTPWHENSIVQW
jgi:hypothetical protein